MNKTKMISIYDDLIEKGYDRKRLSRALDLARYGDMNKYNTAPNGCDCPDYTYRREPCKHIMALWLKGEFEMKINKQVEFVTDSGASVVGIISHFNEDSIEVSNDAIKSSIGLWNLAEPATLTEYLTFVLNANAVDLDNNLVKLGGIYTLDSKFMDELVAVFYPFTLKDTLGEWSYDTDNYTLTIHPGIPYIVQERWD